MGLVLRTSTRQCIYDGGQAIQIRGKVRRKSRHFVVEIKKCRRVTHNHASTFSRNTVIRPFTKYTRT